MHADMGSSLSGQSVAISKITASGKAQSQAMFPLVKMASAQTTDGLSKYFPLNFL